jgi:NAD(P)H-dependent FMN reductase
MSASPGALGGLRGLVHVRSILGNIGVLVIPDQVAVGSVHNSLNESGTDLQEGSTRTMLRNVVSEVARLADLIHQS